MTVLELLDVTTDYFKKNNLANPRLDAEVLLAHALKTTRLALYMAFDKIVTEDEKNSYRDLVKRRSRGEPVAYLTGIKEFWSLPLAVGPGVLVPRPETEILVDSILKKIPKDTPLKMLELATGSGAITCALAKERPHLTFVVTDISLKALDFARRNFETLGFSGRIEILCEDLMNQEVKGSFDWVLSNPPYVARDEIPKLAADIRDFEPALALDGGAHGLDFYRKISQGAPSWLKPGGSFAVEIGEDQGQAVSALFMQNGFSAIEVIKDYAGHDRVVTGKI